jgi:hypothetical protein
MVERYKLKDSSVFDEGELTTPAGLSQLML